MQVEVLGPFGVVDDAGRRRELRGRSEQILAALTLQAGRTVSDDLLGDLLWGPGDLPPDPSATLRTYVARARKAVAPVPIERAGVGYLLDLDPAAVDATVFEQRVTAGLGAWRAGDADRCCQELEAALGRWKGRPWSALEGWAPADVDAARLEELHDQAAEYRAAARLALGDPDSAVAQLVHLTDLRPLRELRWELLIRGLVAQGRQADALRAFQRARDHLVDELGIEPSPRLRSIEAAVLAQSELPPLFDGGGADDGAARPVRVAEPGDAAVTAEPIVGRSAQLDAFGRLTAELPNRPTELLVLSGEAGIGKTRLLDELSRMATAAGVDVYWGRCFEAEASGSYRPITEVLSGVVEHTGVPERDRAHLAILLPELRTGVPASPPGLPAVGSGDDRQFLLFDAAARLLGAASAAGAVVVLDDVQWADASSIDLMAHCVRHAGDAHLLVAVGLRPTQLGGDSGLPGWLAQAGRATRVTRLELGGLDVGETADLVRRVAPTIDDETVAGLHRLTDGNPLFLRELAMALRDRPRPLGEITEQLPSGLADILRDRLASTESATEVLRAVAVNPDAVPLQLIEGALGRDRVALLDDLDALVARGLLVERDVGGEPHYSYSHELLRVAARDQQSLARRATLHHALALAADRLMATDHDRWVPLAAHHWFAAGRAADPARAEQVNAEAGRLASTRTAFAEALADFERALVALGWQGAAHRGAPLHLGAAQAAHRVGDVEQRRRHAELAFELASVAGDVATAAEAAIVHGGNRSTYGRTNPDTTRLLVRANELLGDRPDLVGLRARALARLAQEVNHSGELATSREMSAAAVDLAAGADDDRTAAAVFRERVWTLNHPDWLDEREAAIESMLERAARVGDPELEMEARIWRAAARLERADTPGFDEELECLDRLAPRSPVPALLVRIRTLHTTRAAMRGDFAAAMELAQRADELGQRVEPENADQVLQAQMIAPLRELGLLAGVLPAVGELADAYDDVRGWQCALVFVLAEAGDTDGATEQLGRLRRDGLDSVSRDLAWALAVTFVADAAATLGDAAAGAELVPLLAPFSGRNASLWDIASNGAFDHHLGRLHALLGDHDRAVGHLSAALDLHRRSDQQPMALRSEIELAVASARSGGDRAAIASDLDDLSVRASSRGWTAIAELATRRRLEL